MLESRPRQATRVVAVLAGCLGLFAGACTPGGGEPGPTTTTTTTMSGAPTAVASAAPVVGEAPLSVTFDSSGSSPGTGTGLTYTWDFGDGSPTASGSTATHIYQDPGNYSATLTMANSVGSSTSPNINIQVNVDPNPKFYVRTNGSTGSACGPLQNPCSSIAEAQANAVANNVRIIRVAGGNYQGPLNLVSGMEITGGWELDFSDYGPGVVTTIYGTATAPAVIADGISNTTLAAVSAQGVERTSGDAVGILVTGASSAVNIGASDAPETFVGGGAGPNATGVLVADASSIRVVNAKVNSGTTSGAASSAYGVRAIGQSVVQVTLSEVTAQPGAAGENASAPAPPPAKSGSSGGNGDDACGAGCPGLGGDGGN